MGKGKSAAAPTNDRASLIAAKAAAMETKAAAQAAKVHAKSSSKAAAKESKSAATAAAKSSKAARKSSLAAAKESKAAVKAAEAAAAASATKPTRLVTKLTDPKLTKRTTALGKIIVPALAPFALKAAAHIRGFLDEQRAHRLGVPLADVAVYRGPTGPIQARLGGLSSAVSDLAARKSNDLQVIRFTDVARERLTDLAAGTEAAATMPRAQRSEMLRAIGFELDRIGADLMSHVLADSRA